MAFWTWSVAKPQWNHNLCILLGSFPERVKQKALRTTAKSHTPRVSKVSSSKENFSSQSLDKSETLAHQLSPKDACLLFFSNLG